METSANERWEGFEAYKFVVNPFIHKEAGISREEFIERLRPVTQIRTADASRWKAPGHLLTLFPRDVEEFKNWEGFHRLVNTGDFSCLRTIGSDHFFALAFPPQLFDWFRNVEASAVTKQIVHWLSAMWVVNHIPIQEKDRLCPLVKNEVVSVVAEHFPQTILDETIYADGVEFTERVERFNRHYRSSNQDFVGALPPEFLKDIQFPFPSEYDRQYRFDNHSAWGLDARFPLQFGLSFLGCYFSISDWEGVVIKREVDTLERSESHADFWQKWLYTYSLYEARRDHVFSLVAAESRTGFVYLFRGEESGHHKVGFTGNTDPYSRRSSLQTGSSERLIPSGHFRASEKTEKVVKEFFHEKRVRSDGEWFALSDENVGNLLDENWRIKNNIL